MSTFLMPSWEQYNDLAKVVAVLREARDLTLPDAKKEALEICKLLELDSNPYGSQLMGWTWEDVALLILD